jgi:hypothetical protein
MEIPLNAQVECTDGACGRSEYVLINLVSDNVTHVVVKEDRYARTSTVGIYMYSMWRSQIKRLPSLEGFGWT